jgi:dihydropteroate synthase
MRLLARGREIRFPRPPMVMGIVNLCADSFSGDGLTDVNAAITKASAMVQEGAEIIDVGAESARTNRGVMEENEETGRICEFIQRWKEGPFAKETLLSINTWRPAVARAALECGGEILNDIGALPDAENARICAETGAALLVMHSVGQPKVAHTHVGYDDVMARMEEFFREKIALAESAGLGRDAIILDPGIDFAKQRLDNLRIYRELSVLRQFERPVLLPVSRKTVIGEVLGIADPASRDSGTVACLVQGVLQGAQIFRVHNVRAAVQTIRTITAVEAI